MRHEYIKRDTDYCVCVLNSRVDKRYEWFATLEELNVSALHIVDESFSWYHQCIDKVRPLLDQYRPAKIVGSSMGGYAALLFGSLHGIRVKAFAPQTTIKAHWDQRWTPEWQQVQKDTKYPEYLDLEGMMVDADIYYCVGSPEDARHARRMKANVIPRGCARHDEAALNLHGCEIFDI